MGALKVGYRYPLLSLSFRVLPHNPRGSRAPFSGQRGNGAFLHPAGAYALGYTGAIVGQYAAVWGNTVLNLGP